ncbi:MAG: hypothetical protein HY976_04105 [Candidatus Kerfeldbacteria bacterium]|nr:hypothetical protein [Candidatus Kerfeldbacteria bacterium]
MSTNDRPTAIGTAPQRVPTPAEVVAAMFGDKTYGRRRVLKPHGTRLPKSFKPPRRPRRSWQPGSHLG